MSSSSDVYEEKNLRTLTLERIDGSAEITADNDFIALVLIATALSLSTLRICKIYKDNDKKNRWRSLTQLSPLP